MSTEIYYFSGSGNSLHVAQELRKRIPETTLLPIVGLMNREFVETHSEIVGFLFPQYASTLPKIVAKFVKKLDLKSARYIFAIATRGGTDCIAFLELDKILEISGRSLDSYFVLNMPGASQPLVKSYTARITEERVSSLESEMLKRLDSIHKIIANQEISRIEDLHGTATLAPYLVPFSPIIDAMLPALLQFGKHVESSFVFYFDAKCTGCGMCESVCLAQRIKMVSEKPVWQKEVDCYGCFACLNFCPEQSVQIKSTWYLKSHTNENGRYHHPEITAKDIAGQKTIS